MKTMGKKHSIRLAIIITLQELPPICKNSLVLL